MELIERNALGIGRCNPDIMLDRAYAAGWNGVINIIEAAPTIDPLHALGACYCRECLHHNKSSCPAYDAPFNRTSLRIEYCNCGERKLASLADREA